MAAKIHGILFLIKLVAENGGLKMVVGDWVPFRSYSLQGEGLAPLAAKTAPTTTARELKNQTFRPKIQNTI